MTRSLSAELMPPVFTGQDLLEDLGWLAGDMKEKFGLSVRLHQKTKQVEASDSVREFLIRAVRELLFNVIRHAKTKMADVTVKRDDADWIMVQVKDNGKGIAEDSASGHGLGLAKLRERVNYFGGQLRVESSPGKGTCVTLVISAK